MKTFVKHLVECHCTLALYKGLEKTLYHQFPVYSKIDENDKVIEKTVQCNNCGVIHKVIDVCKTEILGGKDENVALVDIDDIAMQLDDKIVNFLVKNECDITTWEHVLDIVEEARWGEHVVIRRQVIDGELHVKTITVISESKLKIENHKLYGEIYGEGEIDESRKN